MARQNRRRRLQRLPLHSAWITSEPLETRALLTVGVQNVSNFNVTNPWGDVLETEAVGNHLFFAAAEPNSSSLDLWRSDGTTAGTIRLTSLGPSDNQPRHLTNVNGTLYFRGHSAATGHELWKSNGTVAGTTLVRDIRPGTANSTVSDLINFNGTLLFTENGDLHRSNGTTSGTFRVKDLFVGASDAVSELEQVGNSVYFRAKSTSTGFDLYRTSGTNGGTTKVEGIAGAPISSLTNVGGRLYFVENDTDLWTTTPSEASTSEILSGARFQRISDLTDVSGQLFFARGSVLFKSNGTTSGTSYLPGGHGWSYNLFNGNGTLFFSGGDRFNTRSGSELWKSDQTQTGTILLKDINERFNEGYGYGSYPSQFTNVNGQIFFVAEDVVEREGLWVTDGTENGTINVERGGASSLTNVNGSLMFFRNAWSGGVQLHKLSPGATSSVVVPRNGSGTGNSNPGAPVVLNGDRYLFADDGASGRELRRLKNDGKIELVAEITPGSAGTNTSQMVSLSGLLYFSVQKSGFANELWRSDGTATGTFRLATVQIPAFNNIRGTSHGPFVDVNGTLFFTGVDRNGTELWRTDGTITGTSMVKDIFPGSSYEGYGSFIPNSSSPSSLTNLNGTLFFSAYSNESGRELWKSDGTSSGTMIVADLLPNGPYTEPGYPDSSYVSGITNRNGTLFFAARNSTTSFRLWSSNGTSEGTSAITDPIPGLRNIDQWVNLNGQMLFTDGGDTLWTTDFTTTGTKVIRNLNPIASSPRLQNLTVHDNLLYFSGSDGIHGTELWRSNGTSAGTVMVRDLNNVIDPVSGQPPGSDPAEFTSLNGVLFFTANDGRSGRELWYTNGQARLSKVTEALPGAGGSDPTGLTVWNNSILFAANSVAKGRELFRTVALAPSVSMMDSPITWTEGSPFARIAKNAVLTDPDTPVFNGGRLTVTVSNPVALDQLRVLSIDAISMAGSSVVYGSGIIGSLDSSSSATKLVFNLNLNATLRAVERLIRSIGFQSTSDNPTSRERVVRITLEDGESGLTNHTIRIQVIPVNDRPTISGLASTVDYKRDSASGVAFAASAIVADADNVAIAGGRLTVQALFGDTASNRIAISGSLFSVNSSNELLHAGVLIGTVNAGGGIGATPLIVTFNSAARVSHAQQLLRVLKFKTIATTSTAQRSINISLSDGSSGFSEIMTVRVRVLN